MDDGAKANMFVQSGLVGPLIIGFLVAILFLILSYTTLTVVKPESSPPLYYWASLLVFPALTSLGFFIVQDLTRRLGGRLAFVLQFYKFVLVGVLNTLLDLTVLNGLIVLSGLAAGWQFSLFKGVSFVAALVNSYLWNKFWTFNSGKGAAPVEFGKFLAVSLVGFGINVGTASFLVNVVGPLGGIKPQLWASIAAVAAIGITTFSNFVGYKIFVFKKQ